MIDGVDRGRIDQLIDDAVPGRGLLERSRTIAGQAVKSIDLPGLPAVEYRLRAADLLVGVGGGVMAALLGPGGPEAPGWLRPPPAGARSLAVLALDPERLTNLPGLLTAAGWLLEFAGDAAERMAGALARYRRARLDLWLDGSTLVLRGAMQLRP